MVDRATIIESFVRVCKDSGFTMPMTKAAALAARVCGIHPLQVWIAVGSIETMDRIADGSHQMVSEKTL